MATFEVTSTTDNAVPGSLRLAIRDANVTPGLDVITFDIGNGGVETIDVGDTGNGALPTITDQLIIDGRTQPGHTGTPLIRIDGTQAGASADGLRISADTCLVMDLFIFNFGDDGVSISGDGNSITGCYIGAGNVGNGDNGIEITGSNNVIGAGLGGVEGNVISGNGGSGVRIQPRTFPFPGNPATGNSLVGNFIGTNVAGDAAFPNLQGVSIASANNTIGDTTAARRNIISGNEQFNVLLQGAGATGNRVLGNYIGTNAAGTAALGGLGLFISGAPGNTIGGTAAGAGNVVSGNGNGVIVLPATNPGAGNVIQGNFVGTRPNGVTALGNTGIGVWARSPDTLVGGTDPGSQNIISGNGQHGVYIDLDATNVRVQGNRIGINAAGADLGNLGDGVHIEAADGNLIGGTTTAAANVIAGNAQNGVRIVGINDSFTATGNRVEGNRIGVGPGGGGAIPNDDDGVRVDQFANSNIIGGITPGAGNVIVGNLEDGVRLLSAFTLVAGNHIGINFGTTVIPNGSDGIDVQFSSNTLGGTTEAARNVIGGNAGAGVHLQAGDNRVLGNYIGTDVTGTADRGNAGGGVLVVSSSNRIGGAETGAGNLISGNAIGGILFTTAAAVSNHVRGNRIGTTANGAGTLGNDGPGVRIFGGARVNNIGGTEFEGGPGAGNRIAFNAGDGVQVDTGEANAIVGNSIHSNAGLGIDLDPGGVNANDPGDGDAGPNDRQNYPVLTAATVTGGFITVRGTLDSSPSARYRVEFYSSPAPDPTAFGEGTTFLGFTDVMTDAAGLASFNLTLPAGPAAVGTVVAATATKPVGSVIGNTSEFSRVTEVADGAPQVAQVYVAGTGWTPAFRAAVGDPDYGYPVPAGADQLDVLAWGNLDEISVRFSEDVDVQQGDLSVSGVNVASYPIGSFAYDAATFTATWTLSGPIGNDRIRIDLEDGAPDVARGPVGLLLDGEWADGADAFPSGDGAPGGDCRFRMNVLPGDADGNGSVTVGDVGILATNFGLSPAGPGQGDFNGDGDVTVGDVGVVATFFGQSLPAGEPANLGSTIVERPRVSAPFFVAGRLESLRHKRRVGQ